MTVHEPVRRDGSTRLGRYLALVSAASGAAATQVAEASLVTSDPSWSRTLTASSTVARDFVNTFGPGANLLNGNFAMSVTYQGGSSPFRAAFARAIVSTSTGLMGGAKRFVAGDVISNLTQIPGANLDRLAASGRTNAGSFSPATIASDSLGSWQMPGSTGSVQGFIPFAFSNWFTGDWYFGYFDVTISKDGIQAGSSFSLTINAWAYNGTAGQSITLPGASAVPGGTALAALAFGAAGLRGRRRSRH